MKPKDILIDRYLNRIASDVYGMPSDRRLARQYIGSVESEAFKRLLGDFYDEAIKAQKQKPKA